MGSVKPRRPEVDSVKRRRRVGLVNPRAREDSDSPPVRAVLDNRSHRRRAASAAGAASDNRQGLDSPVVGSDSPVVGLDNRAVGSRSRAGSGSLVEVGSDSRLVSDNRSRRADSTRQIPRSLR